MFCIHNIKITQLGVSEIHSICDSGLFTHTFECSCIRRYLLIGATFALDNTNTAGEYFSYPEVHKMLTLLLCRKGMVTCNKYTVMHLHDNKNNVIIIVIMIDNDNVHNIRFDFKNIFYLQDDLVLRTTSVFTF